MPFNEKGQAFESFRLMIGAILAVAILLIIMGIIGYLEYTKYGISSRMLYEGLENAAQTPNGEMVVRKNLSFKSGTLLTAGYFAQIIDTKPNCITIQARTSNVFDNSDPKFLQINSDATVDVYYQCFGKGYSAPSGSSTPGCLSPSGPCDLCCFIGIGVKTNPS